MIFSVNCLLLIFKGLVEKTSLFQIVEGLNWGCPADLLINTAVLDPKVHSHTTRAPPVGIEPRHVALAAGAYATGSRSSGSQAPQLSKSNMCENTNRRGKHLDSTHSSKKTDAKSEKHFVSKYQSNDLIMPRIVLGYRTVK